MADLISEFACCRNVVPILAALKALDLPWNMHANQGVTSALYLTVVENGVGVPKKNDFFGVVCFGVPGVHIDGEGTKSALSILRTDGMVMAHDKLLKEHHHEQPKIQAYWNHSRQDNTGIDENNKCP